MTLTLNEFRDLVADKVMPGLDFLKRAMLVGLLNNLTDETFTVLQKLAAEVGKAHETGGLPAVQQLLKQYDVPDELVKLLDDEQELAGWLGKLGLSDLLEIVDDAAAQHPNQGQ